MTTASYSEGLKFALGSQEYALTEKQLIKPKCDVVLLIFVVFKVAFH